MGMCIEGPMPRRAAVELWPAAASTVAVQGRTGEHSCALGMLACKLEGRKLQQRMAQQSGSLGRKQTRVSAVTLVKHAWCAAPEAVCPTRRSVQQGFL